MKKMMIAVVIILVTFLVVIFVIGRTFYPDNVAETSVDGGKKVLKTRTYKADLETATKTVKETIPTLSSWGGNWKLVDSKTESDSATFKVEIPVVVFRDDLEVKLLKKDEEVQVDVMSKSRVGQSDFGENARNVRKILNALDEKFGKVN